MNWFKKYKNLLKAEFEISKEGEFGYHDSRDQVVVGTTIGIIFFWAIIGVGLILASLVILALIFFRIMV